MSFLLNTESSDLKQGEEFYFLNAENKPEDFKCTYVSQVEYADQHNPNRPVRLFWYSLPGHNKGFLAHNRMVAKILNQ